LRNPACRGGVSLVTGIDQEVIGGGRQGGALRGDWRRMGHGEEK
jgi:hypothetical protein